jgi:hypothetical protein
MKLYVHLWYNLAEFFVEWDIVQTKVAEKIKTHILCSVTFFYENHAFCDITWKNIVQPVRPQMTIWRMFIAGLISKATNTHSEYVIFIAFPLQWTRLHVKFKPTLCLLNLRNSWQKKIVLQIKIMYASIKKVFSLQFNCGASKPTS